MPIWRRDAPEPEEEPILTDDWHIYESAAGERRLVGCIYMPVREGLCSSPIVAFDPAQQLITTSRGRRYRLRGRPGLVLLSETMRNWWQSTLSERLQDVSREYWLAMRAVGYLTAWEQKRIEHARADGLVLTTKEAQRDLNERLARSWAKEDAAR